MTHQSLSSPPSRGIIARHGASGHIAAGRPTLAHSTTRRIVSTGEDFGLMLAQYLEIKAENPDHILFSCFGDFCVLFSRDAEIASRTLPTALTRRGTYLGTDVLICFAPSGIEDRFQEMLLAGHCVALCDPDEDLATARKRGELFVVRRRVVRLYTLAKSNAIPMEYGPINRFAYGWLADGEG